MARAKQPVEAIRARLDWPNPNHGGDPMIEADCRVSHAPTRYWVDVILTTAWECRRFDCEREALAYAQVYARLPSASALNASRATVPSRKYSNRSSSKLSRPMLTLTAWSQ
jgi:hypothetical protein